MMRLVREKEAMKKNLLTYIGLFIQWLLPKKRVGHGTNDGQLCFGGSVEKHLPAYITFKQSNGVEDSLSYRQIMEQRHLPNKGIILMFNTATVIIRGIQLEVLFEELTLHRVAWVGLYNVPYEVDKLEPHIVVIESIEVKYKDTSIEQHFTHIEKESSNDEK